MFDFQFPGIPFEEFVESADVGPGTAGNDIGIAPTPTEFATPEHVLGIQARRTVVQNVIVVLLGGNDDPGRGQGFNPFIDAIQRVRFQLNSTIWNLISNIWK